MKYLLPTFIILPILEMYILIKVGGSIGAFNTILLVLLTAFVGLILLRAQGFQTLFNARNKIQNSELPAQEIFSGFFLAIGGALLLTPGFITDIIGFLFIFPMTRIYILGWLMQNLLSKAFSGFSNAQTQNDWIEGEYKKHK
tara:strand:- start:422 stop:847 length:426 start_codon:yes stop_codon:yes gene_type:complete